ncbi:hypothetical protein EJ377_14325 [Chryseobacterium arthrosphaerae]|uniref:Uncharacterized protein n=1 Tax=Chryseobacterium arthrosphaerae TaxID=651561 RepID=A0A3S0N4J0_9FLAO|nr:hypothetical protein EJ377_14325 [Chryseobacterium arthrosphaerae]
MAVLNLFYVYIYPQQNQITMKNIKTIGVLAFLLTGTGVAFAQSSKVESIKGVAQSDGNKKVEVEA